MYRFLVMIPLAIAVLMAGCTSNRSISHYSYGYNPSYRGELSQLDFIKEVSGGGSSQGGQLPALRRGERVLLVQSGQAFPDGACVSAFGGTGASLVPIAGMPGHAGFGEGGVSLLAAARSGDIDRIIAYWGTVRESHAGLRHIVLSVITVDVATGCWRALEVRSEGIEAPAWAFLRSSRERADDAQIIALKRMVYQRLVARLQASQS